MPEYWGEHKPGPECPCNPKETGRFKDGVFSFYYKHKAPEEDITDPDKIQKMNEMARKSLFGDPNVIIEG